MAEENKNIESVKEYYGKTLSNTTDLQTCACVVPQQHDPLIDTILESVPDEVKNKYYGCGRNIPIGVKGLNILDLGSGSGRDCYILSKIVGENGFVTGVDMTDEQLDVANRNIEKYCIETLKYDKPNMKFIKGYIENLIDCGIKPSSVDLVISNCVVNLSNDKKTVLKAVYDVLKDGGEMYFSDIYVDRKLPKEISENELLRNECIGGALYINDFIRMCNEVGFIDPRIIEERIVDGCCSSPIMKEMALCF